MSGIMGIDHLNSHPVNHQDLEKMVDILAHRGPDHADIWVEEFVGLGHRMLWTTPESLIEKLPLINQAGNLVITADARIDNREQLITLLVLPERPIEKITDSEFILAAYEKWGESCPEHLLGDFAFAIWDKRQQSLFCARDHFGIKPFYYYYQPNQIFLFASEIKALFCVPDVPWRLNEVRIADYLALMMSDKAITTYQDILRLPPAHSLVVNQSGIHIWSYWSLDYPRELQLESNADYAAEFQKIFTEAVSCRLRSAFAIATHLSGGLDSSAVSCVARNLLATAGKTQLHTISTIFDKITECDERPFINAVLDQGGFIPHYTYGDQFSPLADLDKIFQYEDEALLGPSHFYPWNLNRISQEMGLRICLDGFDGDTTVSHGTTRLTELAHQGNWKTFAQEVKALSPHHNVSHAAVLQSYGLPYLRDLAKQFRWIAFAQGVQQIYQHFGISRKLLLIHHGIKPFVEQVLQLWRRWRRQEKAPNLFTSQIPLINSHFAESINFDRRLQTLADPTETPLTVKEEQWRSLTQGLLTYTLEQMDQYAAMFSLEARHPFMDKRLIEFCLALPSEQKLYQGWGRIVMRRALENILPKEVQWRGGKADLTPNFIDGLLNRDRQLLDQVMSHKLDNIEKFIDIDFLRAAYQRLISAGNKVSDEDSMAIWQAVTLALWLDYKQVML
ncbi:lasso peptide isopeptide bond-forming cyclase [Halotia wernerae UHCC 0503]|nr:lasso peptide isopeptide bond-forming cyclase [Halotia wernerae UHCC 0503]